MKTIFLSLLLFGLGGHLRGQTNDSKPLSFTFDFEFLGNYSMVSGENEDTSGRLDWGGAIGWNLRYRVSPLLSLETGLGVQSIFTRQRYTGLRFGTDFDGQQSYLESRSTLTYLTLPVGLIVRPNRGEEGFYFKPSFKLAYLVSGDNNESTIYETPDSEGLSFTVPGTVAKQLVLFPGLAFGHVEENEKGKAFYAELNFAFSAGDAFEREAAPVSILSPLGSASLITGGIKIGWIIGRSERDRSRPKKAPLESTPGLYSGR